MCVCVCLSLSCRLTAPKDRYKSVCSQCVRVCVSLSQVEYVCVSQSRVDLLRIFYAGWILCERKILCVREREI